MEDAAPPIDVSAEFDPNIDGVFQVPTDDAKVWRYLDFTKFVFLFDSSRLFFARMDTFEDAFEGSMTVPAVAARQEMRSSWRSRGSKSA